MAKYLLSSDNGYHWDVSPYFESIEDAVFYYVNEQIDEYYSDWKEITIKDIKRPYFDKSRIIVILFIIDADGYEFFKEVHLAEMELNKPTNKHNIKQLNKQRKTKSKYLLSEDNGYPWNTNIYFDSIKDAVIYYVNEHIGEYCFYWYKVYIKDTTRPIECVKSHIEAIIVAVKSDGYAHNETIYISEIESNKPINKYEVEQLPILLESTSAPHRDFQIKNRFAPLRGFLDQNRVQGFLD